jgi:hypothetical protein
VWATALTLLLVGIPYAGVAAGTVQVGPSALLGLGPVGTWTVLTWAATQRLVKFMLTGHIHKIDRTRRPPRCRRR